MRIGVGSEGALRLGTHRLARGIPSSLSASGTHSGMHSGTHCGTGQRARTGTALAGPMAPPSARPALRSISVTPPERPTDQPTTAADDVAAYRSRLAHLIGIERGRVAREAPSLPSPATFLLEETIAELQAIEDELREQNDALLDAK